MMGAVSRDEKCQLLPCSYRRSNYSQLACGFTYCNNNRIKKKNTQQHTCAQLFFSKYFSLYHCPVAFSILTGQNHRLVKGRLFIAAMTSVRTGANLFHGRSATLNVTVTG